jgi:sucrose-6F-phosphate phosphohydrolase
MDLDGTMVGDPVALAQLNGELAALRGRIGLAYVTGRGLASTLQLIASEGLLTPDAIVAGVGTAIHHGPAWQPDRSWHRLLSQGWSGERVNAASAFFPALVPQPESHQGLLKRSFYLEAAHAPRTLRLFADALRHHRTRARLVYSSGVDLDVLPTRAGKGNAVRHLVRQWGLSLGDTLVCGDSGNDWEMLSLGCPAAMVANAQPELHALPSSVYRARAPFAAGVHEALHHFGWLGPTP